MKDIDFFDLEQIKKIAKKAGDEIMKYYQDGFNVEMKEGNQPITEADLVSNKIIQKGLFEYGFPILSEESKDDKSRLESEFVWIVDPLDGTSDFIGHTGEFSVMIGLVKKNEPILGVVYQPVSQKYYFAKAGEGAFFEKDGKIQKISVSNETEFSKMKILVSRNHLQELEVDLAEKLKLEKITQGSAGLKLAQIALGESQVYLNSSDKTFEWDTCAGYIILKEAGGEMTDMRGKEILYNQDNPKHLNGFVATNKTRHEDIIKELEHIL